MVLAKRGFEKEKKEPEQLSAAGFPLKQTIGTVI